jgi:hypothetical protein
MKERHEGYEQLGAKAAGLLIAVAHVLQKQNSRNETLERIMQANVDVTLKYVCPLMTPLPLILARE